MNHDSQSDSARHTNRLAGESSPYLLQHAHNPVDWQPWDAEALRAARESDRPIFLSVGYSTCYWCHVMERQCFENETIAALMNRVCVCIKVDREERPDVDQLYMTFVQMQSGHGGWPMSVFLTPGGRPFFGGTYFPPADSHGRPGFPRILEAIDDAWKNRRDAVEKSATQVVDILSRLAEPGAGGRGSPSGPVAVLDEASIDELLDRSTSDYDPEHGGFGSAPKFPRQTLIELILTHEAQRADSRFRAMAFHELDALARGGIRDQLGGGFHRYSTDAAWLVPHFEIMLYDNAMLAWLYAEAYRQSGRADYARVARQTIDFVLREMTLPAGAFYTAFDAEVDAREGQSYLWTAAEIESLLGNSDAELFNDVYGVSRGPNFADPHHGTGQPDANVLFLPEAIEDVARRRSMGAAELESRLAPLRQRLYEARRNRKQPMLDTKVLTSWNALMIRALAHAGKVLHDEVYLAAGQRAADYLLDHHRGGDGQLFRTGAASGWRQSGTRIGAFVDDYAFLIQALLDLDEARAGSVQWPDRRGQAEVLAGEMLKRFGDSTDRGGLFFTEIGPEELIVRQKTATDSPLPSGNAVAATALVRLGRVSDARAIVQAFAGAIEQQGEAMSSMVQAAWLSLQAGSEQARDGRIVAGGESTGTVGPAKGDPSTMAGPVTLEAIWRDAKRLEIVAHIAPGYHVQGSAAPAGLIATRLSITGPKNSAPAVIDYPPGDRWEGRCTIIARLSREIEWGQTVDLSLYFQACTDEACQAPASVRLRITKT